ncbi:MAG: helix-turn-helix domain-containing protein [Hyphomonadaceae bacterium]|nr:helix-turn-helix domain-containing protein [Hyphomonadaceae bacterium]MBY0565106.1 helix-turn-helix domain-containing protein [Hyphomonadaceae bacterium]
MRLFDVLETAPVESERKSGAKAIKQKPASAERQRPVVLSAREAAQYLGVSVSTLKNWRAKKVGPHWVMRGARLVAYKPADLDRFLDESSAKR